MIRLGAEAVSPRPPDFLAGDKGDIRLGCRLMAEAGLRKSLEGERVHLSFHDTHAYPGCGAILVDDGADTRGGAVVEFSDGSVAAATYELLAADEMLLRVDPYTTARRTRIPAKSWILRRNGDRWKVTAKADRRPPD